MSMVPRLSRVLRPSLNLNLNLNLSRRFSRVTSSAPKTKYFSDKPTSPRFRSSLRLPLITLRSCSFRRHKMCRTLSWLGEDATGGSSVAGGRELLPTNVVPKHYDLTLEPNFSNFTFEGSVVITVDVAEKTQKISLHTFELDIHTVKISSNGTVVAPSPKISYDADSHVSTFEFDRALDRGVQADVEIKFTGQLNDKMAGFYRSTYKDKDGKEGVLATTQMEPTDARRAFPCFDEPALKAKFTITLVADKELTCLSNMDVAAETEIQSTMSGGSKKAVKFNTTPLMSTYLVAFIVGKLNYIESKAFRVPIRVYAPPVQDIEHGRFSLDLAARTLAFYEKEFGIDFPLPKMDQVAIPDFAQGAMENWGLVTYRVVDLLIDESVANASVKERVAEVVQHELAHQWFGNLVTMDWWDGLWLNEGFATWASWYSCNAFYPEWKVWQTYVIDNLQSALGLDSLRSSHPIEVPVKRSDEINQIFDAISYSKGSCVIRMLSTYLGEGTFMEGIRQYLKKHAYGNTRTNDLWDALSKASGKDVSKLMTIWTREIGFPVVTVTEKDGNTIHLKQNRFLRTGDTKPEEDKVLYPVFLGLRTKDGVDNNAIMHQREGDFKVPDMDFFKVNANHSSIYRTCYSPQRLEKLGQAAKDGKLTVEDRAGMIADAGALATSGYQKTSGVFNLLKAFDTENEFVVWSEIIGRISTVKAAWIFEDERVREALVKFQHDIVANKAHEIGWEFSDNDGHILQQFKSTLFGTAGLSGDEKIKQAALDMFKKFMAGDQAAINPNIRGSVFAIAIKYGGKKEYDDVLEFTRTTKNSHERLSALRTLGRSRDPELMKRTLSLLFSDEIKSQDIYVPATGLRTHPAGIEALFEWMKTNWDELVKRHPPSLSMLGTLVSLFTSGFTKPEQLSKVEEFFANKDTKGYDQNLKQSLDAIRAKVAWLDRDREDVRSWLEKNKFL